jgi:hypothetical protein
MGGGSLGGRSLPPNSKVNQTPTRAALLAAAVNHDWICPGNWHGRALEPVERLLVLYTTWDPALQRYHLVDRCSCASALGYTGIATEILGAFGDRVEQVDVTGLIGRSHSEHNYFRLDYLRREVCRALFHPLPASNDGK